MKVIDLEDLVLQYKKRKIMIYWMGYYKNGAPY